MNSVYFLGALCLGSGCYVFWRHKAWWSRLLALTAIAITWVAYLLCDRIGDAYMARARDHWKQLLAANPGKTLAEAAPGFSMDGFYPGLMALFSLAIC